MGNFFGELIRALRHFITRDIMYLVGGASVGITLLHVSGQPLTKDYPTAIWLWAAGAAYGVGYVIQEILSLFSILTTAPVLKPKRLVKWLYRRFTRTDWLCVDPSAWETKRKRFEEKALERTYAQYQRTIGLKHIGSTLGANWLVCGFILVIYAVTNNKADFDWTFAFAKLFLSVGLFDWALAFATLFLSLGLIAMAWVKGAQQTQHICDWVESDQTDEPREPSDNSVNRAIIAKANPPQGGQI